MRNHSIIKVGWPRGKKCILFLIHVDPFKIELYTALSLSLLPLSLSVTIHYLPFILSLCLPDSSRT